MVGKHSGVARRLQSDDPHLVSNHCVAHRLAPASAQAVNDIRYLNEFKDVLRQLFRFYHNSGVRMSGLKAIQDVLGETDVSLKEGKDVRWLSHNPAVSALRRSYSSVIQILNYEATEHNAAPAVGLLTFCLKFRFIASLLPFSDDLPPLAKLSKLFQKKGWPFTDVKVLVDGTKAAIEALKDSRGMHLSQLSATLEQFKELGVHESSELDEVTFREQIELLLSSRVY